MSRLAGAGGVGLLVLTLLACSGGDDDAPGGGDGGADGTTTASTAAASTHPEYERVIAARREAQNQLELARANPTNPENPVLRDFFTDVSLLQVIDDQVLRSDSGNGIRAVYPDESQHRFEIESVTFSATDPNRAWLETCWVDDAEDRYLGSDQVADVHMSIVGIPPIRTVEQTEEMWLEDGRWRVAKQFQNVYADGVQGCALDDDYEHDYREAELSPRLEQDITRRRAEIEQAWLQFLQDGDVAAAARSHAGFQHDLFFANPAGEYEHRNPDGVYCPHNISMHYNAEGVAEPFYLQDDALNPWKTNPYFSDANPHDPTTYSDDVPCYVDYQVGTTPVLNFARIEGKPFDPSSSSSVVVRSIELQDVESPQVAYLSTCRSYSIGPPPELSWYQFGTAHVTATEALRLVDGAWKLTNRWGFTRVDSCG